MHWPQMAKPQKLCFSLAKRLSFCLVMVPHGKTLNPKPQTLNPKVLWGLGGSCNRARDWRIDPCSVPGLAIDAADGVRTHPHRRACCGSQSCGKPRRRPALGRQQAWQGGDPAARPAGRRSETGPKPGSETGPKPGCLLRRKCRCTAQSLHIQPAAKQQASSEAAGNTSSRQSSPAAAGTGRWPARVHAATAAGAGPAGQPGGAAPHPLGRLHGVAHV